MPAIAISMEKDTWTVLLFSENDALMALYRNL